MTIYGEIKIDNYCIAAKKKNRIPKCLKDIFGLGLKSLDPEFAQAAYYCIPSSSS
jgi:hypothetical protein